MKGVRCPRLSDLPPPPESRQGWPWTEETPHLPPTMPDGRPWPTISVVTPSFRQAPFVEETIRSVLLQGYPDLEYYVIDGGSTDGSVDVIRRYEPWLAGWVSEPDRGQSHAIGKGFARTSGDVLAWLNSDDTYLLGALGRAATIIAEHPEAGLVYGDAVQRVEGVGDRPYRSAQLDTLGLLRFAAVIPQPTVFMRRATFEAAGGIDEEKHFALDYDLWLRCSLVAPLHYEPGPPLALDRRHPQTKGDSLEHRFWPEIERSFLQLFARPDLPDGLRRERTGALARTYYARAGVAMLSQGDPVAAAGWWLRAVRANPRYLMRLPFAAALMARSWLGHRRAGSA